METKPTSLPAVPDDASSAAQTEAFLRQYENRQRRQYNRLFIICWLIILVTGLVTLFLVSGLRFRASAAVVPGF